MPIPRFDEIKAPALQFFFADNKPHKILEVYDVLGKRFNLTEDDLSEVLPSGKQRRWHNRVNWACYDLFRAGLLDRLNRGVYLITEAGRKVADENPPMIDRDFLMKFPEFEKFQQATGIKKAQKHDGHEETAEASGKTPEELISAAFEQLQAILRKDLLDSVAKMDWLFFEKLVIDLLVKMGYGGSREEAAHVTKASGDEGIDGIINQDRLGLDVIYVQAKRWQADVGRKEIQSFVGALAGKKAQKGVFITTSGFRKSAQEYAKDVHQKVILVDGERLADLMIEHDVGVSISHSYYIKKIDSDYFDQE
ncbi:MAG TPA: restriction endonuclease [Stellaceae bacterium]|nr:restriction endonuclease [Stellaceae bacterium]